MASVDDTALNHHSLTHSDVMEETVDLQEGLIQGQVDLSELTQLLLDLMLSVFSNHVSIYAVSRGAGAGGQGGQLPPQLLGGPR